MAIYVIDNLYKNSIAYYRKFAPNRMKSELEEVEL